MKRLKLAVITTLLFPALFPAAVAAFGRQQPCFVGIRAQHGIYRIKGEFYVQAPLDIAWDVLSDYAHISDFVTNVDSSKILERRKTTLLIAQKLSGKVFFINRSFDLKLLIDERPQEKISFTDISQKSFLIYKGSWELSRVQGQTRVVYRLKAKPKGWAPWLIGKHAFKSNAEALLKEIRSEIIRREEGKVK